MKKLKHLNTYYCNNKVKQLKHYPKQLKHDEHIIKITLNNYYNTIQQLLEHAD
jgi:hypothetical protein